MRYRSWRAVLALVACSWGLVACTSEPVAHIGSTLPKAEIQFVDLQGFDRDLGNSLSNALPKVEVAFYDRIAPSALPERLQHWMAAESG